MKYRCFTLFEIILAIAILVVMMAGTVAAWSNGMRLKRVISRHSAQTFEREMFIKMFSKDIESIVVPGGVLTGHMTEESEGDSDEGMDILSFHTAVGRVRSESFGGDFVEVEYLLMEDEDEDDRMNLYRYVYTNIMTEEEEEPVEQLLLKNVEGLQFDYFGGGDEWLDSWDTELNSTLPKAIKATVTYYPKGVDEINEPEIIEITRLITIEK